MSQPLWTWDELVSATGGMAEGVAVGGVTDVSIDTRTLQPGDLFVALRGDNQNGEAFVTKAFEKGAAAALVSKEFVTPADAGPLVRVEDTLKGLEWLGVAARARLSADARVIAVTGSVGKTSTKEMLWLCLRSVDARTHKSEKSYNNHWGVPLTLARMPRDTRYGVFEIGMNHAGEITPLTRMVRPHVAVITTVGPVHLGHFNSVAEIADAKAEIFAGLELGGVAVLPFDGLFSNKLKAAVGPNRTTKTFGERQLGEDVPQPDFGGSTMNLSMSGGTRLTVFHGSSQLQIQIGTIARHQGLNALAAIAAMQSVNADIAIASQAFGEFEAGDGRGATTQYPVENTQYLLINEGYNANPISMKAALVSLSDQAILVAGSRRIAVLGDMRELGDESGRLHRELLDPVTAAKVDLVFACGPYMRELFNLLPGATRGAYAEKSTDLIAPLLAAIAPGDVIMVKGSLGTNMKPIVEALKAELTRRAGEAPK